MDAAEAWRTLFSPHERIAIKVNTIDGSRFWTHVPLVTAVATCLQEEAGLPAEDIVIFDRRTDELESAGFTINRDGHGVRCYGTGFDYTKGWERVISPKRCELVFERGLSASRRFVSYAKVQWCMIILSLLQAEF